MALSMDLRARVLSAIDGGMNCRAAAARFAVAPSMTVRWQAWRRATGNFACKPVSVVCRPQVRRLRRWVDRLAAAISRA